MTFLRPQLENDPGLYVLSTEVNSEQNFPYHILFLYLLQNIVLLDVGCVLEHSALA
jgi:hypothetical protein